MKKLILSIISGSVITISCSINKKDLLGKYSFTGKNVIDTLIIKEDIYVHKIYNKNSQLMYQGKDKWTLERNRINLKGFYNNEDNELLEPLSNEEAKKFLMLTSFPVYEQNNHIIVEINADEDLEYIKVR
ncbi:hypothetical protein ACMGDK_18825 [Chryseobacterium sp. DT-3]|uniref:hypothetical protein n=1 Tax=Chryseobacterium sp. DT-3 TaxID=3396164 RepID=UPI003F1AD925